MDEAGTLWLVDVLEPGGALWSSGNASTLRGLVVSGGCATTGDSLETRNEPQEANAWRH